MPHTRITCSPPVIGRDELLSTIKRSNILLITQAWSFILVLVIRFGCWSAIKDSPHYRYHFFIQMISYHIISYCYFDLFTNQLHQLIYLIILLLIKVTFTVFSHQTYNSYWTVYIRPIHFFFLFLLLEWLFNFFQMINLISSSVSI